jgi:hypothetical protein
MTLKTKVLAWGQAQKYGGVKPFKGTATPLLMYNSCSISNCIPVAYNYLYTAGIPKLSVHNNIYKIHYWSQK